MTINELHNKACSGENTAEEKLFDLLTVRFRLFAHQRIWNEDDVEDIVQSAIVAIVSDYKTIVFDKSFSAWAYKVLDNRILSYIKAKSNRARTLKSFADLPPDAGFKNPDPNLEPALLDCMKKVAASNRRYARILNLYYQGFSTDEVCARLKMTSNHSYVTLSRARSLLELCLETGDIR